ncbi:MAG: HD domain-containing protein [Alphaproteobacteria bacterium]|nr:HD domain-containing protein [Alphaproteobacteria bacterium]
MIDDNRYKHIRGVAELMAEIAPQDKEKEMFLLGMLHDIGYLYQPKDHNFFGGNLLKEQGYKYWQEVYWHGVPDAEYTSYELDLLNSADMQINGKGELVSYAERLEDIAARYGNDSSQYLLAKKMVDYLNTKGLKSLKK